MLTLALIGHGRWGQKIRATLAAIPGAHLKYICVLEKKELANVPANYQATTSSEELVAREDIDAVVIATPGATHVPLALPFIEKGLPVFIEKPLATSQADADKLQQAAQASESNIFVGHIHLYNGAYQKAKELAQQNESIRALYFEGMNNGPYRNDMSALWDWTPHDIAMAIDLLKEKPQSVQALAITALRPATDLIDTAVIKLIFPRNIVALLTVSWLSPEKRKKMTVVGSQHTVVFDDTATQKIVWYENMGPQVTNNKVMQQQPTISYPAYDQRPPLQAELAAFLTMVTTKQPPRTGLQEGVDVVSVIAAAQKSFAHDGKMVPCTWGSF